ncbi:GntR family transcriptional regulator [Nocardioides jejuensis]|uniref:GntR family transcriptional regulator n=1 Tax=Nocardioides jejuensis TaxID=2502782 RepID=A0A4R1CHP5_9ACTN|nr:GntR family transcriptional regulator [Nocardioides jejuensis]TCJ30491.1 GntR family transcriptional regulator [Nocardioides jejuensis]
MTVENGAVSARYRSLKDLTCEDLRTRIVDGRLAPGERLVERDLAEQLEVSRIVVREAIAHLVSEGLAVTLPRRGAQVAPLDVDDVSNLFDIRVALDALAARTAAKRRTDDDLAALDRALRAAGEATAAGDHDRAAQLNADFHDLLMDAAHNPQLAVLHRSISGQVRRVFRITQDVAPEQLHHEHEDLLAAVRAGDSRAAARAATHHVESARAGALERLRALRA